MVRLEDIDSPADLRRLDASELPSLADQIRGFLIRNVSRTGGHLGPNLGVVELTLGLHRVFRTPRDSIVFDIGHQAYVHKVLTGRRDFSALRRQGGLSGYPNRAESSHDIVESSHASSSLSWADGIARAHQLQGDVDRHTVVLIGDGALTGGMAWEAINSIAADSDRRIVIVLNDNGRSYAPTVGGLANHLAARKAPADQPAVDQPVASGLFEALGMHYIGPINGHDTGAIERALKDARGHGGPVLVHAKTEKGRGYAPARADVADQFHTVGIIDPDTGAPAGIPATGAPATGLSRCGAARQPIAAPQTGTEVFSSAIADLADQRPQLVGITAAMLVAVGLEKLAARHPGRVIDVGIAEQHALTCAAGLAYAGMHPVVALYSTFLNRAFDQLLMDVALHHAGVTLVLDRAGVTGPDGPSHSGMWDLVMLQSVPGVHIAAPRDAATLREELREAVDIDNAPSVLRYPKGDLESDIAAVKRLADGVDVLAASREGGGMVLLIAVGAMASVALDASVRLCGTGIASTVVDPRWVLPVARSIADLAAGHCLVVVVEDGIRTGGVGSRIRQELGSSGVHTPLLEVGLPAEFLAHGTREEVLERAGLTGERVAADIIERLQRNCLEKDSTYEFCQVLPQE